MSKVCLAFTSVKFRIKRIEVLGIQLILDDTQGFTESLEVDDFAGPQEFNRCTDIRIVLHKTQDIVIGGAGLLLCRHILKQIRNRIPLGLEFTAVKGDPACRHGPDAYRVVHVIIGKSGFLDFLHGQIPGQLVHDG